QRDPVADDPDRQHGGAGGVVVAAVWRRGVEGLQHRNALGHRDRHLFLALYRRADPLLRPAQSSRDRQGRGDAGPHRAGIAGQTPMELTPLVQPGRQVIERYGAAGFRISGAIYHGPVLVFPDQTTLWQVATVGIAELAPVIDHGGVELLLLGLGRRAGHLPPT